VQMKATKKSNPLAWLRRECHTFAGMEEKVAWGHPTFHIGGHTIAAFEVFHGRPSIAVLATPEYQDFLVKQFGFFKTLYSGRYGWVSAWVDVPAPWSLIRSLLAEAYKSASEKPTGAAVSSVGKRSRKSAGRFRPKKSF